MCNNRNVTILFLLLVFGCGPAARSLTKSSSVGLDQPVLASAQNSTLGTLQCDQPTPPVSSDGDLLGSIPRHVSGRPTRVANDRLSLGGDRFNRYSELATAEREGVDFEIQSRFTGGPILVLAIHGGRIESGTSELAALVAGSSQNLYLFNGIMPAHNFDLHITSTHFDEPRSLDLVKRSKLCVSIHGFKDECSAKVCVGGANVKLQSVFKNAASRSGLPFEFSQSCEQFLAKGPDNIVNKCAQGGLQLELSSLLREQISHDAGLRQRLANVIREAAESVSASP